MSNTISFGVGSAGEDLSGAQFHAVSIAGSIIGTNLGALGLVQNKPEAGENASVAVMGYARYRAGAAIATGASVSVTTSGWLITTTSGSIACGKALEAVSSGGIGEGIFNFPTASNVTAA